MSDTKTMPEWEPKDAIEVVAQVLADNTNEDQISDEDCQALAKTIVERLEKGPHP